MGTMHFLLKSTNRLYNQPSFAAKGTTYRTLPEVVDECMMLDADGMRQMAYPVETTCSTHALSIKPNYTSLTGLRPAAGRPNK